MKKYDRDDYDGFFGKLKLWWDRSNMKEVKHVITVAESYIRDERHETASLTFDACAYLINKYCKVKCGDKVTVSTHPIADPDFVLEIKNFNYNRNDYKVLTDATNERQYDFCHGQFKRFFPIITKRLYVKGYTQG